MKVFDLVVIGSGPGGYICAAKAGSLGLKTAIIEKDKFLGGTCLHKGCIPTKFLLHISDQYESLKKLKKVGLSFNNVDIHWNEIIQYKNKIIKKNAFGVNHIMKSNNITIYSGNAQVSDMADKEYTITIFNSGQKEQIQTRNIVFATGSRARNNFMNIPISGNRIINSDHILNIKEIPKSLVIIGGGVVGCEFASVFSGFDTRITILENSDSILPMSDKDCRNTLTNVFKKNNIDIKASASVTNIIEDEKSITLSYNQGNQDFDIKADYCLIATGREANMDIFSSNIPQNKLNKIIDNGLFSVNKNMETSIPGLYAIGDCIKTPWLAHVASSEGIIAAESIASIANINFINYEKIPMCVYTSPSIAWCGLTEDKVDISSDYVKVSKFPLVKNGKAAIMLENEGFVKCITDRETNEILGFHIMGKNATELIAEPSFAMQFEATIEEIGASMHAHPTLYESIYEAALIALGKPLHG